MRLILLNIIAFIAFQTSFSQEKTVYFSDVIKTNIKKYNTKTDIEFEKGNFEKDVALFDSLVQNHLVGSKFDDYSFKCINSRKVKLSKIKKPVFIITYTSWCVMNKGEIPALNKLARKYDDEVQFIVVFWNEKNDMKKISKQFNHKIKVCYANESYNNDAKAVATLKRTLGYSTSYYLNKELEVVDIKRGGIQVPKKTAFKKAFELNYNVFNDRLVSFITKKEEVSKAQLAATE